MKIEQYSGSKWWVFTSLFFILNLSLLIPEGHAQVTPTAQTLSTTTPLLSCSETGSVTLSDSQGGILYTIQDGGTVWSGPTGGTGTALPLTINSHSSSRTLAGYANLTSVRFDGTDDYIETNGPVIPSSGDFTVSVWAREDVSVNDLKEMLSQGTAGNAFYMGYNGEFDNYRLGDTWAGTTFPYHNDSNWHHYAIVKTATNTYFYLDGVLRESLGSAIANPSGTNFRIGRQYGGFGEYWDGNISHVLVANTAFSQAEVQNAMNLEYTGNESNVVAYYKLDENTGTSASGTKAGSVTGTLYNGPAWERTTTKITNDVVISTDPEATAAYNWYQSTGDNLACYAYTYGKGTEADPMELENIEEVQLIDSYPRLHYQLTNNINAAETRSWNSGSGFDPIVNFSGSLDGNGYIIDSLYINRTERLGLFDRIDSVVTIQRLGLSNIEIIGELGLAGIVYFLENPGARLSNVFVTGTITGTSLMGGLVDNFRNGTIENSYASVTMIRRDSSFSDPVLQIGGLVARTLSGTVTNSFWDGTKQAYSPAGFSRTSDELKIPTTFANAGWDLENIWKVRSNMNEGYPSFHPEGVFVNSAPTVGSATILGDTLALSTLQLSYTFSDADYDIDLSTFQWFRSDDVSGTNKQAIPGATAQTYVTVADDFGKYINVEVTAKDQYSTGNTITTALLGPFDIPFSGGDGSPNNPFQIRTAHELQNMERKLDAHYILSSNVDASETQTWNGGQGFDPIGTLDDPFVGTLISPGNIIDSLFINRAEDYVGLFGVMGNVVNVKIEQVGLTNVDITGRNVVGGLAGSTSEIITNTFVTGSVTATADTVGGLVGIHNSGETISYSYSNALVSGSGSTGGLIGVNNGTVTGSFWDTETSGQGTSAGGTGKTTNEMKQTSTFNTAGWDYSTLWFQRATRNDGYPLFINQGADPGTAPSVSNVQIQGAVKVGEEVSVNYLFTDAEGDADLSTFQWYIADDSLGTNKQALSGASDRLLFIDTAESFLGFSVTPIDFQETGEVVFSPFVFIEQIFDRGNGSPENPFQISNVLQLQDIQKVPYRNYILVDNIDASETSTWNSGEGFTPIEFSGTLNGNGFIIRSLYVNRPTLDRQGLFGNLNGGTVINLGLEDVYIHGRNVIGSIAGYNNGYISDSYATGTVIGSEKVGGLVGQNPDFGFIVRSYTTANVNGQFSIGGFAGENGGTIRHSFSRGDVTGESSVGGFAGFVQDEISYSYSTGLVTGNSNTGGFAGLLFGEEISNSFWDASTSGTTIGVGVSVGVSFGYQADLNRGYAHWDFSTVWAIDPNVNDGYPFLQEQKSNTHVISGNEGWRMMASPVSGASFSTLLDGLWTQGFTGASTTSGSPNIYFWDEPTQSFIAPTSAGQVPAPGQGFIMYMFADDDYDGSPEGFPKSLSNSGTQHSGQLAPTLSFTNTDSMEADGWNLVGNPYGTTINWNAPNGWSKDNLDQTIYVWSDSASGGAGAYKSWNGSTGTLGSGKIAPWQGFWVKANAADPSITVTDSVRNIGGVFLKKAPTPELRLTINESTNRLRSTAIVMFSKQAHVKKDPFDAYKLASLNGESLSLGTSINNELVMDIQALPLELQETELDLDIRTGGSPSESYTLSWNPMAIPEGWQLTLIDRETGEEYAVNEEGRLEFELKRKSTSAPTQSIGASVKTKEASPLERGLRGVSSKASQERTTTEARPQREALATEKSQTQKLLLPNSPIRVLQKSKAAPARFVLRIITGSQVSIEPGSELPAEFGLDQNYPNPFNPSTVINYQLPVDSKVRLEVFDMLGRKVSTLVDGEIHAGYHEVNFDARNLASGMYLYRLQTNRQIFTQKMMLIK